VGWGKKKEVLEGKAKGWKNRKKLSDNYRRKFDQEEEGKHLGGLGELNYASLKDLEGEKKNACKKRFGGKSERWVQARDVKVYNSFVEQERWGWGQGAETQCAPRKGRCRNNV